MVVILDPSGTHSNEPTPATHEQVGRLCAAWAFLELMTEQTLWGILDITKSNKLGPLLTWRLDMRTRWQMILDHAPKKHSKDDIISLKEMNKKVGTVTRDRNIIVHGVIHGAWRLKETDKVVPCWTAFRGVGAGKAYFVSTTSVSIVRENIQKLAHQVRDFNASKNYSEVSDLAATELVTETWPVPL